MSRADEAGHPGLHEFAPQVDGAEAPEQSGLREYAHLLWRKKVTVLLVAAIAVGGMLAYCFITPKTYTATATMLLEPPVSQTLLDVGAPSSLAGIINVSDKIQEIESGGVAQLVAKTIPNAPGVTAAEVGTNTDVVTISVSSGDPHLAAAATNAYAAAYIQYERNLTNQTFSSATKQIQNKVDTVQLAINNVQNEIKGATPGTSLALEEGQLGQLQTEFDGLQNQLQQYEFYATQGTNTQFGKVLSTAGVPSSPSSPKTIEYTVLALIFGLVAGMGVALLINAVSTNRK